MNVATIAKIFTLGLWAWGIMSFISPESVFRPDLGRFTAIALLVAHAIEIVLFTKKLVAQVGGSALGHAFQLLLFGVFHVKSSGAKIGRLGA